MTRASSLATACDGAVQLFRRQPRFGKFVAVGCINAVVSYSIFSLAHFMTHADRLSVVITWCVGIVFNFFSTGRMVFDSRDLSRAVPFVLSYVVSMGVNLALISVLLAWGIGGMEAQAICLPVVVVVSYLINSRLVFRRAPICAKEQCVPAASETSGEQ
jgi:putative flippase GtrA